MAFFGYVVSRDFGFAPNPFHGVCSLATCKPMIRRGAHIGDYILGFASRRYAPKGRATFVMRVDEILTFDSYWSDLRFRSKRPVLNGSLKRIYGDNIYHHSSDGSWIQENSHHSLDGGALNEANLRRDTGTDRVLLSWRFSYWGAHPKPLPAWLSRRQPGRWTLKLTGTLLERFKEWEREEGGAGYVADPTEFAKLF